MVSTGKEGNLILGHDYMRLLGNSLGLQNERGVLNFDRLLQRGT